MGHVLQGNGRLREAAYAAKVIDLKSSFRTSQGDFDQPPLTSQSGNPHLDPGTARDSYRALKPYVLEDRYLRLIRNGHSSLRHRLQAENARQQGLALEYMVQQIGIRGSTQLALRHQLNPRVVHSRPVEEPTEGQRSSVRGKRRTPTQPASQHYGNCGHVIREQTPKPGRSCFRSDCGNALAPQRLHT